MPLLVRGGRIIDPAQAIDRVGDLLATRGKVVQVGQVGTLPETCLVVDASGMVVTPGFVDLHCHLREPGFEHKEAIATGTRAAARGGFTTVCCMPNTNPPLDTTEVVQFVREKAAQEGIIRVLPVGCITKGRRGEGLVDVAGLAQSGVVALSDDGSGVADPTIMRQALAEARRHGLFISDHCEDAALSAGGVMNEGHVSMKLGLKGIPSAAEEAMLARDIALAQATGGRLHIAHVSTAGSVELIREAKEKGIAVTAEVTPHHLTLTEETITTRGTNAKMYPPLRTAADVAALIDGLDRGVLDAVATDHAPHSEADKACDLSTAAFGISVLETALASLLSLVHQGRVDLVTLVSKLTFEPARVLRRDDLGTLRRGGCADIIIFDPNAEWVVDPTAFASKGRNMPLAGDRVKGKVMATVYAGQLVYLDDTMPVETTEQRRGARVE